MSYPPLGVVRVSQKRDGLNLSMAARVLQAARSLQQEALELAMVEEYKRIERPTVAQICAAWLGERITAEEAMEAISLHPAVVVDIRARGYSR